jgi:hypothetical protein
VKLIAIVAHVLVPIGRIGIPDGTRPPRRQFRPDLSEFLPRGTWLSS